MPVIDVTDSLLVVIDTQPGFVQKVDPRVGEETVDRIRWLVSVANALQVPLVVTEEEPDRNGGTVDTVDAAVPADVTRHVKPTFGLAEWPPIVADLGGHDRGTAILCGFETDVCVSQSALGLSDADWRVAVVEDAVASPGSAHAQGLARMRDAGIELIGVKALAYEWLRTVEAAERFDEVLSHPPLGITL
jgi:nicotinamidase-related amidase